MAGPEKHYILCKRALQYQYIAPPLENAPESSHPEMTLRRAVTRLQKGLPLQESPQFASSVHWTPSENFPVHRWFRYREGFSPYLLDFFPGCQTRLDPFCGCGTTLLESARIGIRSYGIDLNPLATFVAQVKTQSYSGSERIEFIRLYKDATRSYKRLAATPRPNYELLDKLFLNESIDALLRFRTFIDNLPPGKVHNLLFLAWLSILEESSNTFKEGNGLKYRNKKRRPDRYETVPDRIWIQKYFGDNIRKFVEDLWLQKCEQIAEDIESFRFVKGFTPVIRTGSCLDEKILDFGEQVDLAIFSPPYANRFDYFEAFKIELWMGGFVKNQVDMADLRGKSVRNNLAAARFKSEQEWKLLKPFLIAMDLTASSVRMGIKQALEGYFYDMRRLLYTLRRVLTKRGKVVIVVGNSAYAKSIIPTDTLIARLGEEEQFHVNRIHVARKLHVSSQQRGALSHLEEYMRESVVVLEKA